MVVYRDSQGIDLFLRNLGVDYHTGAHIISRRIFVYSDHLVDCFARYVASLHLFGIPRDSSVGSLGLTDSWQCYEFWFHRWRTKNPCHS